MMGLQDVRDRALQTVSRLEKAPVADLIAAPSACEWLWLLNAGSMEARARSGITQVENLPGMPMQVVELIGKVKYFKIWSDFFTSVSTDICPASAICPYSVCLPSQSSRCNRIGLQRCPPMFCEHASCDTMSGHIATRPSTSAHITKLSKHAHFPKWPDISQ